MADDFMSDEDKALFRQHMQTVKPLKKQTTREQSRPIEIKHSRPKCTAPKPVQINYYLSDYICHPVCSDDVLSYSKPGIAIKRFREFKNGRIPWEAVLDLHGLKTDAARDTLCAFIQKQYHLNKRCLLIIHGKGGHEGAPPVIKNLVNRWLPQFDEVFAFHSAIPKDGGHGALYVLLKKNKS